MKPRSIILIVLIVVLPIALLSWGTLRLARNEQLVVEQRFRELMDQRLNEINGGISRHFEAAGRELRQLTAIDRFDQEFLRELNQKEPRVLQLFVMSPQGNLVYPDPALPLNIREQGFLLRAARMFTDHDLKTAVAAAGSSERKSNSVPPGDSERLTAQKAAQNPVPSPYAAESRTADAPAQVSNDTPTVPFRDTTADQRTSSGWFVWYWDRGLNLIYWQRRSSGEIVGAALHRARWISDLIADLPGTEAALNPAGRNSDSPNLTDEDQVGSESALLTRIRLTGTDAETIYEWGDLKSDESPQTVLCEKPLAAPLSSWRLQCVVPEDQLSAGRTGSIYFSLLGGLLAASIALSALAVMLVRDYSRDMRQAAQQVSFVNQVSHELKTPLTNIRLYAELLESDLDQIASPQSDRPRSRLEVIISEGQRLSRLISNVLTFAGQQRKKLHPKLSLVIPDAVIRQILERFRPALETAGFSIQTDFNAPSQMTLDADFLEQILGNLFNNVEKYAITGKLLKVSTHSDGRWLVILVEDAGPGVERSMREQIFVPFFRISNDLSQAAGTGIGLSIARDLASAHGGSLRLLDSPTGCRFEVRLDCGAETTAGQ